MRAARLPQHVPEPGALLDRDVELPAEVADVGDPRREDELRADLDRPARPEREALVGHVVRGDAPRMSRARGPQRPIVVQAVVTSTSAAEPSSGSWSEKSLRSAIPWAPPVTIRNSSSPSRMIVRSERKPPPGASTGV